MSPTIPQPQYKDPADSWCYYDAAPAEVCGGPHVEVETDLGNEVVKKGQRPLGTPVSEMSEEQRAAHEEAVDDSIAERNPE